MKENERIVEKLLTKYKIKQSFVRLSRPREISLKPKLDIICSGMYLYMTLTSVEKLHLVLNVSLISSLETENSNDNMSQISDDKEKNESTNKDKQQEMLAETNLKEPGKFSRTNSYFVSIFYVIYSYLKKKYVADVSTNSEWKQRSRSTSTSLVCIESSMPQFGKLTSFFLFIYLSKRTNSTQ